MKTKLKIVKCYILTLSAVLIFLLGVDFATQEPVIAPTVSQVSTNHEEAIIEAVDTVSPAVVSITVSKDVPTFDDFFIDPFQRKLEKREVGGGTGFLISQDGLILTNRHVVSDSGAEFTVLTNDGRSFIAEVLARDPVQDLAVLKIEGQGFPTVKRGDPSSVKIGQTVIAIGNSLGEFRNTVSVGVVSGLGRSISATDGRTVQVLEDVIQTDAAINMGNSGGPLLNLKGEVIGINTAIALDAQSIGFSIPISKANRMIESVLEEKELIYPFLGVHYLMVNPSLVQERGLSVDYGALIVEGEDTSDIARKAGLRSGDIITKIDGREINGDNYLAGAIQEYDPGDRIELTVVRGDKELILNVVLGERK